MQRQIVNTEFMMAADTGDAKQYEEARKLWTEFLAKYPLDPRDPSISMRSARWTSARGNTRRRSTIGGGWFRNIPASEDASRGQYVIAVMPETKLQARRIAQGIQASQRELCSACPSRPSHGSRPRACRSPPSGFSAATKSPKIELAARNIEAVTVRAYSVDLETYFRKMHIIHGVEGLDMALIAPDQTFEFKVPKYAEYEIWKTRSTCRSRMK